MIRLQKTDARRYNGLMNYLVSYDHESGRKGRYTVNVLNARDPVTIGRELPLADVRRLISEYEAIVAQLSWYTGGHDEVLLCLEIYKNRG